MASPPTAPSNTTNGQQGANENGSAKQAPTKKCDDPSCGDDFEMAPPPKVPSAKGKDAKSTAPPPTNRKRVPEELRDGDVAQSPESDDPELDLPPMVQPNKGNGAKSTAPPTTNRKQIPEELDDGDVAQEPKVMTLKWTCLLWSSLIKEMVLNQPHHHLQT